MPEDLISQGIELMVFGMGTVVVFLTLLVFATSAMSALLRKVSPAPSSSPTVAADSGTDPVLLAVITAAIRKHRSRS